MGTFYAEKPEIQTLYPLFLSKKGQDEISETFKLIGGDRIFEEKVKKTISYRLVDYITTKNLLPPLIPPTVISNYSIKTSIGRWIPNSVSQFINERIDKYKDVYISFMLNKHFSDVSFKREKDYYSNRLEKLQNEGYLTFSETEGEDNSGLADAFKKNFLNEYITKLEKTTNLRFPKQDNQSILNIFWDYEKDIDIETLPVNIVISILKNINTDTETLLNASKEKKKDKSKKTKEINVLRAKIKEMGMDLKNKKICDNSPFDKFQEDQLDQLNKKINSLKENDVFSAIISSNQEFRKFEIIFDCIVMSIERNTFGFVDKIIYCSRNDTSIKYLPRNNIELLHKIDKKKIISKNIDNMSKLST
jgi:hypothetical protein